MIALISRDLMAISTVSGAARNLGLTLKSADNFEAIQAKKPAAIALVAVDLASIREEIASLVRQIRGAYPQATIVAFGPHVGAQELQLASAAGCDQVLARGQFLGQISSILGKVEGE